jgi:hypothetical protein
MSGTAKSRGGSRGRGRGKVLESPVDTSGFGPNDVDDSHAATASGPGTAGPSGGPQQLSVSRRVKPQVKSAEELKRIMDIIKSRISVIIDTLSGDDNEALLKRNVVTAVKHLKLIDGLLDP